jgi:O-Antigen ligase
MLAFNAIFSTSTSTYIALVVCLLFNVILTPRGRLPAFLGLVALICLVIAMSQIFPETFQGMFGDKISGDSESGRMRVESSMSTQELFSNFSVMNWLFGFGFGYAYNQVTLAIITNTGLIGFFIYCFAFLKPIWLLPREGVYGGYKTCIFGLFFLCNLTLSELFLPTTWMFLGLAYCKLDEYKRGRSVSSHGRELLETGGFQLGTRH